jgi:hypothetical protein
MTSQNPLASFLPGKACLMNWPRYVAGAVVALCLAAVLWPLPRGESHADLDSTAEVAPVCVRWDGLASEAIVRLVRESKSDADLRRAGDAIFRLRRARRNCNANWVALACADYGVIIRNVPAFTTAPWPPISSVCGLARVNEASNRAR